VAVADIRRVWRACARVSNRAGVNGRGADSGRNVQDFSPDAHFFDRDMKYIPKVAATSKPYTAESTMSLLHRKP